MFKKGLSIILVMVIAVSVFAVIPCPVSAETADGRHSAFVSAADNEAAAASPESENSSADSDAIPESDLDSEPLSAEAPAQDAESVPSRRDADLSATGDPDKANALSDNLFYNAKYYNNDLACVCSDLCCDVDDVSSYFPTGQSAQYSYDIMGSDAFHLGIGYKTIIKSGSPRNLIVVSFRGTGSFAEAFVDFAKDFQHNTYLDEDALLGPYYFAGFAQEKLYDFTQKHPDISNYPLTYLVTGYSLGGAAANLMGAELTKRMGGDASNKVFCYTFGAIKAIAGSANHYSGYGNIHNIYNFYDSWGPNGNYMAFGVSDPYYKFGETYLCHFNNESSVVSLDNHDMGRYRDAVRSNSVTVPIDRKAGILNSGQWWTLTDHRLKVLGSGAILDGNGASWDRYSGEINNIDISDGITRLGSVFRTCTNVKTIWIPDSVTAISDYAFAYCNALKTVYFSGTQQQWNAISVNPGRNEPLQYATVYCTADTEPPSSDTNWHGRVILHGSFGNGLRYTLYQDGELQISGSGSVPSYRSTRAPWHDYSSMITSLVINNGITGIGSYAFSDCYLLETAVIPGSVSEIGGGAFEFCGELTEVSIGYGVEKIDYYAFYRCISLEYADIPDSVIEIGNNAFSGCTALKRISIGDGVRKIGDYAFSGCGAATEIHMSNSVEEIGDAAFLYCVSIPSLSLPKTLKKVGENAFFNCPALSLLVFGEGVDFLGSKAGFGYIEDPDGGRDPVKRFDNLLVYQTKYGSVTEADGTQYQVISYKIVNGEYAEITGRSGLKELESLTIPSRLCDYPVKSIGQYAFESYTFEEDDSYTLSIRSIILPNGLEQIGKGAFGGCSRLERIDIPDSVTSIGSNAFQGCEALTSIRIPSRLTEIGKYMFYHCESLQSVAIPDSVTVINDYAFLGCSSLESVHFGSSLTKIGYEAFSECTALASLELPDSVSDIEEFAFSYCTSLDSVRLGGSLTTVKGFTFLYCSGLKSVTIGGSITSIEQRAFGYCTGLEELNLSSSVRTIGGEAFSHNNIKKLVIPDSVEEIGSCAFANSTCLEELILGNSLVSVGNSAFSESDNLKNVTIGDAIEDVHALFHDDPSFAAATNAFWYSNHFIQNIYTNPTNPRFTSVDGVLFSKDKTGLLVFPAGRTGVYTVPDGVTSIDTCAFLESDKLEGIVIPSSVKRVGEYAFHGCNSLKKLYISDIRSWLEIGCVADGYTSYPIFYDYDYLADTYRDYDLYLNGELVTELVIPDTVTKVPYCAFAGCRSIRTVVVPKTVKLEYDAFKDCTSITDVYYEGTEQEYRSLSMWFYNECIANAKLHFLEFDTNSLYLNAFETESGKWLDNICASAVEMDIDKLRRIESKAGDSIKTIFHLDMMENDAVVQPGKSLNIHISGLDASSNVYRIEDNGTLTRLKSSLAGGEDMDSYWIFTTDSLGDFVVAIGDAPTLYLGDVDGDGEVTIIDATYIQRKLANLAIPFEMNDSIANTDSDGSVTIIDATYIQRWLASLPSNDNIGKPIV